MKIELILRGKIIFYLYNFTLYNRFFPRNVEDMYGV